LHGIDIGEGVPGDMNLLERQSRFIGAIGNTHCALAPGAIEPLTSALKYFREEFEVHIRDKKCSYQ
jgi:NADH-quinone oxidoreductase subunit F